MISNWQCVVEKQVMPCLVAEICLFGTSTNRSYPASAQKIKMTALKYSLNLEFYAGAALAVASPKETESNTGRPVFYSSN